MISGASGGAVPPPISASGATAMSTCASASFCRTPRRNFIFRSFRRPIWSAIYEGGANDRSTFAAWPNENVFDGATYAALRRPGAPIVWINASDIYNGTPFDFTYDTFAALCSDLDKVRIADAVAASAAFPWCSSRSSSRRPPTAPKCNYSQPEWLTRALADPAASVRLKAYARSLEDLSERS